MVISHRGIRDPRIELMPGGSEKRTGRGLESISDWQWCFFLLDPFVIYVTLLHIIFDGNSGNSVVLEHEER